MPRSLDQPIAPHNPSAPSPTPSTSPIIPCVKEPETGDASFRIGRRQLLQTLPDGSKILRIIPLTPLDQLHPQPDDTFVVTQTHYSLQAWLFILARRFHDASKGIVACADIDIDLDAQGINPVRPDFLFMEGVLHQTDDNIPFFRVAKERPHIKLKLVIELTSASTSNNDLVEKVRIYHQAGFEHYVIVHFDNPKNPKSFQLLEYRFPQHGRDQLIDPERQPMMVDLEEIGLRMGYDLETRQPIFIDMATGERLRDYHEYRAEAELAQQERQRAEREHQRAEQERQRAEALERQIQKLQDQLRQANEKISDLSTSDKGER